MLAAKVMIQVVLGVAALIAVSQAARMWWEEWDAPRALRQWWAGWRRRRSYRRYLCRQMRSRSFSVALRRNERRQQRRTVTREARRRCVSLGVELGEVEFVPSSALPMTGGYFVDTPYGWGEPSRSQSPDEDDPFSQ